MEGSDEVVVAPARPSNAAILQVQSEEVPLQLIEGELRAWGADGWD